MSKTPEEQADELVRKIYPISEKIIRTRVFARIIAKLDGEEAVEVIKIIMERGGRQTRRYREALHCLSDIPEISQQIGSSKMSEIYMISRQRGYEDIARMLRDIPAKRHAEDSPDEIYVDRELQDVALGMKKTLGRVGNRDLINRLLHDQDPTVMEQILNNPGLTEEQVLKVAAKRPTSADVLKKISETPKWVSRYRIKRALASNPYTPTQIAIRLLGVMMRQDLEEILKDGSLHIEVRRAAGEVLKNKSFK